MEKQRSEVSRRAEALDVLAGTLEKRALDAERKAQANAKLGTDLDGRERVVKEERARIVAEARTLADETKASERRREELARESKRLEAVDVALRAREKEAADLKSKAMNLLRFAEKTAETKERDIADRLDEEKALLLEQRAEAEKLGRLREDVERHQHRLEANTAEHEARSKALAVRESRHKEDVAALGRERVEMKALWNKLETDRAQVSKKEEAVDALVARTLEKDRETLERETEQTRGLAAELQKKDKALAQEGRRIRALESDIQALRAKLEERERVIEARETDLDRKRDEIRRLKEQLEALL